MLCEFCERLVDTTDPDTHRFVSGWAKTRKGGGTNALRGMIQQDRYAHGTCLQLHLAGRTVQTMIPVPVSPPPTLEGKLCEWCPNSAQGVVKIPAPRSATKHIHAYACTGCAERMGKTLHAPT